MKESRLSSKGLWWDGSYGGVVKDGQFAMLYIKPNIPLSSPFDELYCWPRAGDDPEYSYKVYRGLNTPLDVDEIELINRLIDSVFPAAGGGGGSVPDSVFMDAWIHPHGQDLTFQRADGSIETVNLMLSVQNTPSYVLGFNMKSNPRSGKMLTGTNPDDFGVAVTGYGGPNTKEHRIYMPAKLYDLGGIQKGGEYRNDDTFFISAANVEAKFQVSFLWGFHPDWPKFSEGRPVGQQSAGFWVERWNEDTNEWDDVKYQTVSHGSNSSVPNGSTPAWNSSSASTTVSCPKPARYRIGFVVEQLGSGLLTAEDFKYLRWNAYPNTWGDTVAQTYWQITGSIKDVSEYDPIPPN